MSNNMQHVPIPIRIIIIQNCPVKHFRIYFLNDYPDKHFASFGQQNIKLKIYLFTIQ